MTELQKRPTSQGLEGVEMTEHGVETSPQVYARLCGVLYLIVIVIGGYTELFVRNKIMVAGDATATANNILASQMLWRGSIAGDVILLVCAVVQALLFYVLLRPVNRNLALLAVFFNLVECAIDGVNKLNLVAALFLSEGADYLKAFEPHQLHALAYLSLKLHAYGYAISLIFFGFVCLIFGYLLFRSGYFPKALGLLMTITGFSYLTISFTQILAPAYAGTVFPILGVPAFIGELSLCLWLMVKGVNVPRWNEKARLAG
jgi:Domain of unknown function (DUF4386)